MKYIDEYDFFVEKFKPKKTTDDCYTPKPVYDALLSWVKKEYNIDEDTKIIRPFFAGGDYKKEDYSGNCVVVDNPPFSILGEIIDYCLFRKVRFFLFAPALTLFNYTNRKELTVLPTGADITYENGAVVLTSFVCNLSPEVKVYGSSELYRLLKVVACKKPTTLVKYEYPYEVARATQISGFVARGIDVKILESECTFIRSLDSQKRVGKSIYGAGLLLSPQQAREQQARAVWELSYNERKIVELLGTRSGSGLFVEE